MEAVGTEFNLFEPFMNQTALIREMVQEFSPVATIIQGAPIDFQIDGTGKNYIDLNDYKLELTVKLTTPRVEISGQGQRWAHHPLHLLFQSVTMKIADKVVTESNNLYPYRAVMETQLNYEAEVLKTRLKCEGYEEDVSFEVTDPAGENNGLKAREMKFNNSKVVRLIGRLDSDLWKQEKLIPPGIKLDVQLVTARPPFFIKAAAVDDRRNQIQYNSAVFS